ncbi:type VII secretion protein [Streptomyces sp. NPDC056656]|uniref:type VII secretion protein n=1 Tax=Streptomyces sp. NPDC056656 TaxID=3345895 RepID=UPI00369CC78F
MSIEIDKKATPTPPPPPPPPPDITDAVPVLVAATRSPAPDAPTPVPQADITDAVPVLVAATHSPAPDAPTPVPQADIRDAAPTPNAPAPPPNPPASHLPSAPPLSGLPTPYTPAPAPTLQPHSPAPHPPAAPSPRSRNSRLPAFTPESVPTVDPRLTGALGRAQHGDTVAKRTGHSLRRLASSAAPGASEETRLAREVQQPVANGRVVAVTSIRGGVGKTTVSALLARTLNHYRHDPVLALEADAALGTLPVRLGAESVRWSCPDLAQILKPSMRLTDVTGYLVPVTDGGWLLPASQGRVGAPLDVRTYRTVSLALRRYFAVTVVDCETLPGEVARTAMDTAHARVVVAPMTVEGVGGTRVVLDWLAQLPKAALASTVVALTSSAPDMTLDLKAATAHLRETGVAVVHLPYDRHLAAGGPIRTALLSEATRRAATGLGAEAVQRAAR